MPFQACEANRCSPRALGKMPGHANQERGVLKSASTRVSVLRLVWGTAKKPCMGLIPCLGTALCVSGRGRHMRHCCG